MKETMFRVAFVLLATFGVSWAASAQTPDSQSDVSSGFVNINSFGLPYIQQLGHYEGQNADPSNPGLARGASVGISATPGCQKLNAGLIGIDTSPNVVSQDVASLNDTQAPRFVSVFRTINTDTTPSLSLALPSSLNVNAHLDILLYINCEEGTTDSFVKYRVDETRP